MHLSTEQALAEFKNTTQKYKTCDACAKRPVSRKWAASISPKSNSTSSNPLLAERVPRTGVVELVLVRLTLHVTGFTSSSTSRALKQVETRS